MSKKYSNFFKQIWDEREDAIGSCYCYETNTELPGNIYRNNTMCYHHILPKSKYPQFAFEKWNIVILHPNIHNQVEINIDKCPKVKKLTEILKNGKIIK